MFAHSKGFFYAAAGALLFGTKGVFVKLAYTYGISVIDTMALRVLFSLPFFIGIAIFLLCKKSTKHLDLRIKDGFGIALLAFLGYYIAPLFDFMGLNHISAGLERLVIFTYPIILVFLSCLVRKSAPSRIVLFAAAISYIGISLAYAADTDLGISSAYGSMLVLASAFVYAAYLLWSASYIKRIGAPLYTAFIMIGAGIYTFIHHAVQNGFHLWNFPAEVYFIGLFLGIVGSVIPAFLINFAIQEIGTERTAITAYIGPAGTFILAMLVLDEEISTWEIFGMALVLIGSWGLLKEKRSKQSS